MYLPQLNELDRDREMIEVFKGYNHNLRISEGEFYDMKNLSSNNYPVISPRPLRGVYKNVSAHGIIAKDGIGYIDGSEFQYNNKSTDGLSLSTEIDAKQTIMVSMGANVIIITKSADGTMVDKKCVNTINMTYEDIDTAFEAEKGKDVTFYLCQENGVTYDDVAIEALVAPNPSDSTLWIDTSSKTKVLKQYSSKENAWVIVQSYVKIVYPGIASKFNLGDGVFISNVSGSMQTSVDNVNGDNIIQNKDTVYDEWIVVKGICTHSATQNDPQNPITIKREIPLMDYIIESSNRLWGCRYGLNNNGDMVNEIYASKLGDFRNWTCYQGISTDSYAVSLGSDGEFTGAMSYNGQPTFFKENHIHKIYGSMPSNYQMQTTECRGVMKGASKSLAIVNELLYYKSRGAVCMYDGSYPTEVSQAFGEKIYGDAVGGALGSKYYISLKSLDRSTDVNSVYELFVFDTSKGLWHKEDETEIRECASYMGNLFYIDGKQPGKIKTFLKGSNEGEKEVRWMAKTGIIGLSNPDRRYISKINIRANTTFDSWFSVFIKYNSTGDWIYVGRVMGANLQSHNLPIIPKRCDHFQLKFEGVGEVKIYSICKTIEKGGDY